MHFEGKRAPKYNAEKTQAFPCSLQHYSQCQKVAQEHMTEVRNYDIYVHYDIYDTYMYTIHISIYDTIYVHYDMSMIHICTHIIEEYSTMRKNRVIHVAAL